MDALPVTMVCTDGKGMAFERHEGHRCVVLCFIGKGEVTRKHDTGGSLE